MFSHYRLPLSRNKTLIGENHNEWMKTRDYQGKRVKGVCPSYRPYTEGHPC